MLSSVAHALIQILGLVLVYFLIVWVAGMLHLALPAMVMNVIVIILVLCGVIVMGKALGI